MLSQLRDAQLNVPQMFVVVSQGPGKLAKREALLPKLLLNTSSCQRAAPASWVGGCCAEVGHWEASLLQSVFVFLFVFFSFFLFSLFAINFTNEGNNE